MRIVFDFLALFHSRVAAVAAYRFVIRPHQSGNYIPLRHVGCSHLQRMYVARSRVYADMDPLTKMPLVAFFYLMHLRIAPVFRVFRRTGRFDNGRVHDASAVHDLPVFLKQRLDRFEQLLRYALLREHLAELAQRCRVRRLLMRPEINPQELAKRIAVVDRILHAFVGQIEPDRQQIHPQHNLHPAGRPTASAGWIVRFHQSAPLFPRDQAFHPLQKLIPLRASFSVLVLYFRKTLLLHFCFAPHRSILSHSLSRLNR